jgi:putative oxidoreductase
MSALAKLDRPVLLSARVLAALAFLAPLLTRLVVGWAFHLTGNGKLENFERTVDFFTSLEIPLPALNAAFVARLECWGGLLLIAGLGTRLVAFMLSGTMVVALMTADRMTFVGALKGTGDAGLTDVSAFVFLLFLLWLVFFGPGLLSLDALLFRRWRTCMHSPSGSVVQGRGTGASTRQVDGTEPATK